MTAICSRVAVVQTKRKLLGTCRFTEVDLWLYPTIIRYDACYAVLFKCSRRRITDYPNINAWMKDVYQIQVGDTSSMQVICFLH